LGQRAQLRSRNQLLQVAHPAVSGDQLRRELSSIPAEIFGDLLACKLPDDGAQLGKRVKGKPVVDAPDVAVAVEQAVAALAIGIVDDHVEGGQRPEIGGPRRHQ